MPAHRRSARRRRPARRGRSITVRFNANTNPDLPWDFRPVQDELRVPLGDEQLAFYTARNEARTPVTGVALYNVTPDTVGQVFPQDRLLLLQPADARRRPADAVPAQLLGRSGDRQGSRTPADIHTITLSYTFFRTLEDAAKSGALAQAGPHVGPLTRRPLERADDFVMMRQRLGNGSA